VLAQAQLWDRRFRDPDGCVTVDVERVEPFRHVGVVDVLHRGLLERAVHDTVEPAERLDRVIDQALHLPGIRDVGRHRDRPPPELLDLAGNLLQPFGAARREHDVGAVAGALHREAAPEPGSDSGDEHHTVLEQHTSPSVNMVAAQSRRGRAQSCPTPRPCVDGPCGAR
jgi:hypothetical protein